MDEHNFKYGSLCLSGNPGGIMVGVTIIFFAAYGFIRFVIDMAP